MLQYLKSFRQKKIPEKRVVIFDFDGTIADTFDLVFDEVNKLVKKLNVEALDYDQAKQTTLKELCTELGLKWYQLPLLVRQIKSAVSRRANQIEVFPGFKEILKVLQEYHIDAVILSSNSKKNICQVLQNNQLTGFSEIVSDSSLFSKHKVLKKWQESSIYLQHNCIYVGDEVRDLVACQKAGFAFKGVAWGYDPSDRIRRAGSEPAESIQELIEYFRICYGS